MKKSKIIVLIATILFGLLMIAGLAKGKVSNGFLYQNDKTINVGGPFELSNSAGRYALTESIVKNKSLFLDYELARFSAPDVVVKDGKYTSIFTPAVSLLSVPFYYLGAKIGIPQISAYLVISLLGLLNAYLIFRLASKIGVPFYAALISGFIFFLASNALPYSFGFTQHNLSTTMVLLCVLNSIGSRTWINNFMFGVWAGIGIMADIPNLVLIFPAGLYALFNTIKWKSMDNKTHKTLSININLIGFLLGTIPLVYAFGLYNNITTGSYTTLAQNIGRADFFDTEIQQQNLTSNIETEIDNSAEDEGLDLPFSTRKQINGLYVLTLSDQRSWLYYSPVVLFGILGLSVLFRSNDMKDRHYAQILLFVIILNIVMYSMFGDPYGGWAFGPRYLIPSVALMCVGLGVWLTKSKSYIAYGLFCISLAYSLFVNLLGSLTTSAIPPKVESINLTQSIPHTYEYNWDLLNSGMSSSLIYDWVFRNNINTVTYFYILFGMVVLFFVFLNINYFKNERN